ncbi:MAG TPA: ABC transporter permease [Egibacteraceae bacterium]|nr:ABC transporter permease [Actinomycetota bacterium]HWB72002.1 ABC transporter permease [Egibacteraceae bacterium]
MEFAGALLAWFADPAHWAGADGIPARLLQHLGYSLAATAIAAAVALPVGLGLGHAGRGGQLAINVSNVGRAVPTFGILLLVVVVSGIGLAPLLVALIALAVPPIVTNSYVGVRSVDPEVRDAAEGMGMTGTQVLLRAELPVALPLVMAGLRTSAVQVVATATLAAVAALGGLGRYIVDGLANRDLVQVTAGGLLVAVLSFVIELAMAGLQRLVVPRGLAARHAEAAASAKATAPAA